MSLKDEIHAIMADPSKSYEDKRDELLKYMTPKEVYALLPTPKEKVRLKEHLVSKPENMRLLRLSVNMPIFESVLKGNHVERREYTEYYKSRCTYIENGVRYLVPFDAITFYVGHGSRAKRATVSIKNIVCDGDFIDFYLGEVLDNTIL
ncbi:MAG: hypothetical protein IKP48_01535 [Bacteroidaceae bacterium]|nr:hypothetical protein [Bacteroidaceae bacterium]